MVASDNTNAPPKSYKPKLSGSEISLRHLLKSSPQDLWLDTIRRTRGPQHNSLVYWMLNQVECDFAIAVHAFYRCNPTRHVDDPKPLPQRPGPSDIFALILLNWDTGSFRTHRLQVDTPTRHIARVRQKLMVYPQGVLPFDVPQQFLEPTGGKPMKLPPHLMPDDVPHLWALYADLGLDVDEAPPGFARKIARAKSLFQRFGLAGQQA